MSAAELTLINDRTPALPAANPSQANTLTFAEKVQLAQYIADSGLWKEVNTPAKALSMMMLCESEGLNPMQAMTRYHIAEGRRPSMKSETMQAEFQARGGVVRFLEWNDERCRATFAHPASPEPVEVEWTIARAQQAGIYQRNSMWKTYPRNMLKARVISDGIGLVLPGARLGMFTPEEESDILAEEREKEREMRKQERANTTTETPAAAAPSTAPPPRKPAPAGATNSAAAADAERGDVRGALADFQRLGEENGFNYKGSTQNVWLHIADVLFGKGNKPGRALNERDIRQAITRLSDQLAADRQPRQSAPLDDGGHRPDDDEDYSEPTGAGAEETRELATGRDPISPGQTTDAPAPDAGMLEDDMGDPFAETPDATPVHTGKTTKRRDSRDSGGPQGLL